MAKRNKDSASGITDDPTDKSEATDAFLFSPTKHDILPLILTLMVIALGLTAALLSFFLLQKADQTSARNALQKSATDVSSAFGSAAESVIGIVMATTSLFQISKTPVTIDQFLAFMNSGGSFPRYLSSIHYGRVVPIDQLDNFVTTTRSGGGDYSNLTVYGRDDAGKVFIPPVYATPWSPYRTVALMSVPLSIMYGLIGFDFTTDPKRNVSMYITFQTRKPSCTGKLVTTVARALAVSLYVGIYNYTTNEPTGIMVGTVYFTHLMQEAVALIAKKFDVSLVDMNVTSPTDPFMYSTATASSQEHTALLASAPYTAETYTLFADRLLKVILIPQGDYQSLFDTSTRWVALVLSLCFMVVLLGGCFFLYFSRKLYDAKQKRKQANEEIDLLKTNQSALRTLLDRIANQESKTRAVINAIPDLVCVTDANGRIVQMNTAFESQFPFTQQEMEKGVYTWDIFTELASDFFKAVDDQEVVTQATKRFGGIVDVSIRVRNLAEANGESSQSNEVKNSGFSTNSMQRPDLEEAFVIITKDIQQNHIQMNTENREQRNQFEQQFRDHDFREEFKQFCKTHKTIENVLFLEKVREYKKASFGDRIELKQNIVKQFINNGAPQQLNLANEIIVEETIKINKSIAEINVFKTIEEHVMNTLVCDIYPRFLQSKSY
jgi:PAS domain S-box-containing protein